MSMYKCMLTILSFPCDHQVRPAVANVCTLTVMDVRLIRDKVTSTSLGFCFVEMNNIEVSMCIS